MHFLWKSMHPHKAPVSLEWTRHQKPQRAAEAYSQVRLGPKGDLPSASVLSKEA